MARSPAYFVIVAGVLLWCAAVVTVPLAAAAGVSSSSIGYSFFSNICHQYDSRSFHIAGYPVAICARCSAIYFGFFIGVLLSPVFSRKAAFHSKWAWPKWAWGAAVMPMILDVGADLLGIHSSGIVTRVASGGIFGFAAALILTPLLVTTCSDYFRHSRNYPGASHEPKTR